MFLIVGLIFGMYAIPHKAHKHSHTGTTMCIINTAFELSLWPAEQCQRGLGHQGA